MQQKKKKKRMKSHEMTSKHYDTPSVHYTFSYRKSYVTNSTWKLEYKKMDTQNKRSAVQRFLEN